jgi:hypothetical protein
MLHGATVPNRLYSFAEPKCFKGYVEAKLGLEVKKLEKDESQIRFVGDVLISQDGTSANRQSVYRCNGYPTDIMHKTLCNSYPDLNPSKHTNAWHPRGWSW